jgi:hypothetical protein
VCVCLSEVISEGKCIHLFHRILHIGAMQGQIDVQWPRRYFLYSPRNWNLYRLHLVISYETTTFARTWWPKVKKTNLLAVVNRTFILITDWTQSYYIHYMRIETDGLFLFRFVKFDSRLVDFVRFRIECILTRNRVYTQFHYIRKQHALLLLLIINYYCIVFYGQRPFIQ